MRNNNTSPQKESGAESSQLNKSAKDAHDAPASPVRTPAKQESRERNNNSKQTRKHALAARKAHEQPTRNAEEAANQAETAAENAERAASKAAVLARRASEDEKEEAKQAELVAIQRAKNARMKANEARKKANTLSRKNLARYLSLHRREPKHPRNRETMSEPVNFLRRTMKAKVHTSIRRNQLAAEEGKTRIKGRSARGMAAMEDGEFVDFIKALTEKELSFAEKLLIDIHIFTDEDGNTYSYNDIQLDDEAGGNLLEYVSSDMIDYFIGITERVGFIRKRLQRFSLMRR